jgi:hypothetical protein
MVGYLYRFNKITNNLTLGAQFAKLNASCFGMRGERMRWIELPA